MRRSLFMPLIALLAAACVQVGAPPSGSAVIPSASAVVPSASPVVPSAPAATGPPVSTSPTTVPGTPDPTRTRRPRQPRTDRPTPPPTQPPTVAPSEPPTAPPTEPPLADLVVGDFEYPGAVFDGEDFEISFVIRNIGRAPSGPFRYESSGGVSALVTGLDPGGETIRHTVIFTAPEGETAVTFLVVADSEREVIESDENNNEVQRQIRVDDEV